MSLQFNRTGKDEKTGEHRTYGASWNPFPGIAQKVANFFISFIRAFNPFSITGKELCALNRKQQEMVQEVDRLKDKLVKLTTVLHNSKVSDSDMIVAQEGVQATLGKLHHETERGNRIAIRIFEVLEQRQHEWGLSKWLSESCVIM